MANLESLRATTRVGPSAFTLDLQKPDGVCARAARQAEATWSKVARKLDGIGKNPTPGSWRLDALFGRR